MDDYRYGSTTEWHLLNVGRVNVTVVIQTQCRVIELGFSTTIEQPL